MQNNQEIIKKTKTSIAQEFLQDDGPRVSSCKSLSIISHLCYAYIKYYLFCLFWLFCLFFCTVIILHILHIPNLSFSVQRGSHWTQAEEYRTRNLISARFSGRPITVPKITDLCLGKSWLWPRRMQFVGCWSKAENRALRIPTGIFARSYSYQPRIILSLTKISKNTGNSPRIRGSYFWRVSIWLHPKSGCMTFQHWFVTIFSTMYSVQ